MFKDLQKRGKCTFGRFVMEISTAEMLPDRNVARIRKKPEIVLLSKSFQNKIVYVNLVKKIS